MRETPSTKTCTRCNVTKPLEEFAKNNRAKDGRHSRCKPCIAEVARDKRNEDRDTYNAYQREYRRKAVAEGRARPRDYRKEYLTQYRYGLSREEYEEIVNRPCAICGDYFEGAMHLDHCHETGKVRGGLCRRCNTGLGMFKDDIHRLTEAIRYLSESKD